MCCVIAGLTQVEIVLGYFGLLLTVKVAIFFSVRAGGGETANTAIVIAIAPGFDEHVDGFAEVAGANLFVLVNVGEFVDNNGEVLASVAVAVAIAGQGEVDGVPGGKGEIAV